MIFTFSLHYHVSWLPCPFSVFSMKQKNKVVLVVEWGLTTIELGNEKVNIM
jgi:hypothetical protein